MSDKKQPLVFTDRQLLVIRAMLDGYIPSAIYGDVIEACHKIDAYLNLKSGHDLLTKLQKEAKAKEGSS